MSGFGMEFWVGKGIDDYIKSLETLVARTDDMVEETIKPAAGLVADEVRAALMALPKLDREPRNFNTKGKKDTNKTHVKHKGGRLPAGITDVEREGLAKGLGLAPIRKDGQFINTKLGVDGYNEHKTPSYPKGHPNVMVARSLESGTSYRAPTPFVKNTVRRVHDKAEKMMADAYEKELKKVMNV